MAQLFLLCYLISTCLANNPFINPSSAEYLIIPEEHSLGGKYAQFKCRQYGASLFDNDNPLNVYFANDRKLISKAWVGLNHSSSTQKYHFSLTDKAKKHGHAFHLGSGLIQEPLGLQMPVLCARSLSRFSYVQQINSTHEVFIPHEYIRGHEHAAVLCEEQYHGTIVTGLDDFHVAKMSNMPNGYHWVYGFKINVLQGEPFYHDKYKIKKKFEQDAVGCLAISAYDMEVFPCENYHRVICMRILR